MTQQNIRITAKSTRKELVAELVFMEGYLYGDIATYAEGMGYKYNGEKTKKSELQDIYKKVSNLYSGKRSAMKQAAELGIQVNAKTTTRKQLAEMIQAAIENDMEKVEELKAKEPGSKRPLFMDHEEKIQHEETKTKVVVDVDAEEELEPISAEALEELVNEPAQQEKVETTMTEANVTTEAKETDPKKLTLEQKRLRNIQHVLNTQKPEDVLKTLSLAGFTPTFDIHANAVMLVDNYKAIKESQRKQAELERKQAEPTITIEQARAMAAQVQAETQERAQTHFDSVQDAQEAKVNDINFLYDALKTKSTELQELANQLAQAGKMEESNTVMSKFYEVQEKISSLVREHKDVIFSGARATKLVNDARQSMADGLRTTAVTTDKYGHAGVDTLLNVANQVLNGAVEVSKKVLEGGEAIAKTGINVAGTVGHATVDGVSGTLNAAADIIEPKQK